MTKKILLLAGVLGASSIILDALGHLYLFEFMSDDDQSVYNHAVLYQMIHALALFGVIFLNRYFKPKYINIIVIMFVAGTLLVSGSLYLISLGDMLEYGFGMLKPFTAIGGIILIVAWLSIASLGINTAQKKR